MSSTEKVVYKTFKELYEEEKYKNDMINLLITEYNLESVDKIIEIVDDHLNKKCIPIPVKDTNNIIEVLSVPINIKETDEYNLCKNEKRNTVYYDTSEDVKNDNSEIVKLTSEISKLTKIIEDNKITYIKEYDNLKTYYDGIIDGLKKKEEVPLPSPSSSTENIHRLKKSKNKFNNKNLKILERCNVKVYNYNNLECNDKELHILNYISSENKVLIRFYSTITEKFDKNDDTIWKIIYNFKVRNNELVDYPDNKRRFKYKYLRCKELYKLYGENLSRFSMSIYYLGILSKDEWKVFLEEFDKLYNNTFKNMESCQHKYKNNKICGIFNCNKKHINNI
jgi:hypothetical protein